MLSIRVRTSNTIQTFLIIRFSILQQQLRCLLKKTRYLYRTFEESSYLLLAAVLSFIAIAFRPICWSDCNDGEVACKTLQIIRVHRGIGRCIVFHAQYALLNTEIRSVTSAIIRFMSYFTGRVFTTRPQQERPEKRDLLSAAVFITPGFTVGHGKKKYNYLVYGTFLATDLTGCVSVGAYGFAAVCEREINLITKLCSSLEQRRMVVGRRLVGYSYLIDYCFVFGQKSQGFF